MVHLSLALVQARGPEQVPVAVQVPVLVRAQVEAAALAQVHQLQRLLLPAGAVPFLEAGPVLPPGKAPEVAQLFLLPGTVQARARVPVLVLAQGKVLVQAPVRARVPVQAQVPVPVPALGNLHRRYFPGTPQRPQ